MSFVSIDVETERIDMYSVVNCSLAIVNTGQWAIGFPAGVPRSYAFYSMNVEALLEQFLRNTSIPVSLLILILIFYFDFGVFLDLVHFD